MELQELQKQVGLWSRTNFGSQISKPSGIVLGSLAPLLGVVEEIGELAMANANASSGFEDLLKDEVTYNEVKDAVADICIYLLDYCEREDVILADLVTNVGLQPPLIGGFVCLVAAVGDLCHHTLKYHQGIRGYTNHDLYVEQRDRAIVSIWYCLIDFVTTCDFPQTLPEIAEEVWLKIVSKRNWSEKPNDANQE